MSQVSLLNEIYTLITKILYEWSDVIESATFVGSASPLSEEQIKICSDIDIVVLWKKDSKIVDFKNNMLEKLCTLDKKINVIECWGVVSPQAICAPVVHLHSMPQDIYIHHSSLYRRAVSKYIPILGEPLKKYIPEGEISINELLNDELGIKQLFDKLKYKSFQDIIWFYNSEIWYKKEIMPQAAEIIDYSFYCVLHSIRNTLRLFRKYKEFSSISSLGKQWILMNGRNQEEIDKLINMKLKRRCDYTFSKIEVDEIYNTSLIILDGLIKWLEKY